MKAKLYISVGTIALAATTISFVVTTVAILLSSQDPSNLAPVEILGIIDSILLPIVISIPISHYVLSQNRKLQELTDSLKKSQRTNCLTGLLTRSAFYHDVEDVRNDADRQSQVHALLFIDLDNFKKINDNHGHQTGDNTLKTFGEVMTDTVGEYDIAGRIGGEEFCLFLPDSTPEKAAAMAQKLLNRFQQRACVVDGKHIKATLSIGISLTSECADIDALVNKADNRMYAAKQNGKNQFVLHEDHIDNRHLAA